MSLMVRRSSLSNIFLWIFVCLLTARPALACLTVPSFAPQMTHACCQHACQHEHSAREMEHCCAQQHGAALYGALPLAAQGDCPNQLTGIPHMHPLSILFLRLEIHGVPRDQLWTPTGNAPPDLCVRYHTFLL